MSTAPGIRSRQGGLSLIEVLVGIAVGMIGILVIFQTLNVWDKYTKTAASGTDAQTAGTLGMFNLERDLKHAGLGFGTAGAEVMGCTVNSGFGPFALAPVVIASNATTGTGELRVLQGNSAFFAAKESFTASTGSSKTLVRRGGFRAGDFVVVAGNAASAALQACDLVRLSAVTAVDGRTVDHAASATVGVYTSGTIYNLGPAPQRNLWSIGADNALRVRNLVTNVESVVAENVVDLQAEYGIDTDGDRRISSPAEWTPGPPTDWTRVLAVRIAILVRGRQYEKDGDAPAAVVPAAPTWFGTNTFTMRNVDNTADSFAASEPSANNWRNYRYRVYERVIPLRNMVWGTQYD